MPIIIKNNSSQDILDIVTTKILKNDLVSLPTETVYGLAGLGTSLSAAKKIYKLKKRPLSKKLIFHCSNIDMVKKFFILESENLLLAEKFWPGPLTLILKRKSKQIPISLTKNKYCAVRIPKNLLTLKVISLLARPIVMPSANRFKKLSPINAKMVFDQFLDTNLIIVDDMKCKVGLESTLVNVFKNRLTVIRPGKISLTDLKKVLPFIKITNDKDKSFSGTSKKHYSPNKSIYLNQKVIKKNSAYLSFGKDKKKQFKNLSKKKNLDEAAKNLYHYIFMADNNEKYDSISIGPIPNVGIGIAINDRLKRASK